MKGSQRSLQSMLREQTKPTKPGVILDMSKPSDLTKVSLVILDNRGKTTAFCKDCQKQLETYREIRYHYAKHHELTSSQFKKISKIGRLLEAKK